MILLIDNYDSFTWNLVQRLGEVAPEIPVEVHRNDEITGDQIATKAPSHIVISPGPCTPDEAGISCEVVRRFAGRMPILGVCLGHQSIGQVFGGSIVRAKRLMHGKVDQIEHSGHGLFAGLPSPIEATRVTRPRRAGCREGDPGTTERYSSSRYSGPLRTLRALEPSPGATIPSFSSWSMRRPARAKPTRSLRWSIEVEPDCVEMTRARAWR